MACSLTRRGAVLSGLALAACAQSAPEDPRASYVAPLDDRRLAAIEQRIGGRVGVGAWNTATDQWLGHRRHEAFAMCSTFKWALAAGVLHSVQNGGVELDQQVRFNQSDIVSHSPRVQENLTRGWMTIEELCAATVIYSDNAAANLLLEGMMGPEGFTHFLRANGDAVTRLDRFETALNENLPGDPRDTSTPDAMARSLHRFLLTEQTLTASNREKLIGWMEASPTGRNRIRGGLPQGWRAADKTGSSDGANNATNDVAIVWPPNRAPIVIAAYLSHSTATLAERNGAHAEIAHIIAEEWG